MLIVMQTRAEEAEIDRAVTVIENPGLTAHVLPGTTRTAIGMAYNRSTSPHSKYRLRP